MKKKAKSDKKAQNKNKPKKEKINIQIPIPILKHPIQEIKKPVGSLDLLLSVAESRISEEKTKLQNNGTTKIIPKGNPNEGLIRKAILKDGYVYLSRNWKIEENNLKMKYFARNIFNTMFMDFTQNESKYFSIVFPIKDCPRQFWE